jgi:hypothetical protein
MSDEKRPLHHRLVGNQVHGIRATEPIGSSA